MTAFILFIHMYQVQYLWSQLWSLDTCHVIKLISALVKGDRYLIMSYIVLHSDSNDVSWSVLEAINN